MSMISRFNWPFLAEKLDTTDKCQRSRITAASKHQPPFEFDGNYRVDWQPTDISGIKFYFSIIKRTITCHTKSQHQAKWTSAPKSTRNSALVLSRPAQQEQARNRNSPPSNAPKAVRWTNAQQKARPSAHAWPRPGNQETHSLTELKDYSDNEDTSQYPRLSAGVMHLGRW